jgi:hypothetical protein
MFSFSYICSYYKTITLFLLYGLSVEPFQFSSCIKNEYSKLKLTNAIFPFFRLLVGAPRADARQPGVHKGGAVYKCPALRAGGCEIIPFDKGGKQQG